MYAIIVYDVNEKRVAKVLKLLRKYLNWIQNSVFEGELTDGKFKELKMELKKLLKLEEDSVLIFKFRTARAFKKEIIGQERNPIDTFL